VYKEILLLPVSVAIFLRHIEIDVSFVVDINVSEYIYQKKVFHRWDLQASVCLRQQLGHYFMFNPLTPTVAIWVQL